MTRKLILAGAVLILVGLLIGTVLNWFANPEIATDAHVAGVQHGMLIILIGLAWKYSNLGRFELICAAATAVGLLGIFAAFLIGAVIGEPYPASTATTNILFVISSWTLILGILLFIYGLIREENT